MLLKLTLKYQKWLEAEQEEEEGFNLTLINDRVDRTKF